NTVTANDQVTPAVAMLPTGNYGIAWASLGQDGSGSGVYAQRYTTTASVVSVRPAASGSPIAPGGVVVAPVAQAVATFFGFVQTFDVKPVTARGPETRANTVTTGSQYAPAVATDAAGNYVVAWTSYGQDGSSYGVYAQRYSATGAPLGGEFRVNQVTSGAQR